MIKKNQNGVVTLSFAITFAIAVVALGFGAWAFMGKQSATKDSNNKVAAAVAQSQTDTTKSVTSALQAADKSPTKTYQSSTTYGSVSFVYPKVWSALVDSSNTSTTINGYFFPNILPALSATTAFALRVELASTAFSDTVATFDSQVETGDVKSSAYTPPKMVGVANNQPGIKLTGKISGKFTGEMVILKVRDKTLTVYTESNDYLNDLNNTVLPSLTFVP